MKYNIGRLKQMYRKVFKELDSDGDVRAVVTGDSYREIVQKLSKSTMLQTDFSTNSAYMHSVHERLQSTGLNVATNDEASFIRGLEALHLIKSIS